MRNSLLPLLVAVSQAASAASEMAVHLSLKDGRTDFKIGDPIVLVLSFDGADKPMTVSSDTVANYDEYRFSTADGAPPWQVDYRRWRGPGDLASLAYLKRHEAQ